MALIILWHTRNAFTHLFLVGDVAFQVRLYVSLPSLPGISEA